MASKKKLKRKIKELKEEIEHRDMADAERWHSYCEGYKHAKENNMVLVGIAYEDIQGGDFIEPLGDGSHQWRKSLVDSDFYVARSYKANEAIAIISRKK